MSTDVIVYDAVAQQWLRFCDPVELLIADREDQVLDVVAEIESRTVGDGLFAAGFLTYEAAPGIARELVTHRPHRLLPLAWFGLFRRVLPSADLPLAPGDCLGGWSASVTRKDYDSAIARIRDYIAAGDTYQVNYSFRLRARLNDSPAALFANMVSSQGPGLAAFIDTPGFAVASASHELFFARDGDELVSRPMKGTAPRGLRDQTDRDQAGWLAASAKNRAENLMITDMVRNDLGRIARIGSVVADDLFALERYPTVWQMTSTVRARSTASLPDVMGALFPAASITGAPKRRTMEIIRELEHEPRGIYTGTIGFVRPEGRCQFNVAIRTAAIDKTTSEAEYGVGGGIVWDSRAEDEYRECFAKARIVTGGRREFELLETLAWHPRDGFRRLEEHLERLHSAADYFCWSLSTGKAQALLEAAASAYREPMRVRLLADRSGHVRLEASPLKPLPEPYRVALSEPMEDLQSEFVYHKTTQRSVYDKALDAARSVRPDLDDVLLVNGDGQVTESTIANVAVEVDGRLLTPELGCGLLPGIERQVLVADKILEEARVPVSLLVEAERIWLLNSVRGMWLATLVATEQGGSDLRSEFPG